MGFMHQKYNGLAVKSSIEFLRIINANLNDMQTIYTTIMRAIKGTHESSAIVTFDLPLFIKASQIVEGSGLAEAMSVIYGPNTVKYILKGGGY